MKRVILMAIAMVAMVTVAEAQMTNKELLKELQSKVVKDCRKEAKQLLKDGWRVAPGALSLERQLQDSQFAQKDKDEDGNDIYAVGRHVASGGSYSIAKSVAQNRARTELAGNIMTDAKNKVKDEMGRKGVTPADFEQFDKHVTDSENISAATLTNIKTTLEIFREKADGTVEFQVMMITNKIETLERIKAEMEKSMTIGNPELWSKVKDLF